jgi:putative SOS response-associated peptidase YedK
MCGRFTFQIPSELLVEIFGLAELTAISPRYNIAPTQQVPVIRRYGDGQNHLDFLHWGLIPPWALDKSIGSRLINARSETVTEMPSFRQAIRYRRCLVLASSFYEWQQEGKAKQPWLIRLKDGAPMVFAGLWETWKSAEGEVVESCAILTTASNRLVAPLHDRMPVVLTMDEYRTWLERTTTDPTSLKKMFQPYPADLMVMYPVSPLVNKVRNDSADLIESLQDATTHDLDTNPSLL